MNGHVEVRRSSQRPRTVSAGIETRHSFSFGAHYDPANTGHALLLAHNEDRVEAGSGYPTHPHRDLEIVTWVRSGALRHEDSAGRRGVVGAGTVQRVSAGSGIEHAEWNDASTGPQAHFVQMWVLPDEPGTPPSYAQASPPTDPWVTLASGLPRSAADAVVPLGAAAALHLARLSPGEHLELPDAPYLHLFVAEGEVDLAGAGLLGTGDAVRLTGVGGAALGATTAAELLVWELHRDASGSMGA